MSGLCFTGDAHFTASGQKVSTGGGGSCAVIGQLLPLQAVWKVSKTSHIKASSQWKPGSVFGFRGSKQVVFIFESSFSFLFLSLLQNVL